MLVFQVVLCFVVSCFLQEAGASEWESGVNEEGRNVQTLKIQAPSMTEEDQYGYTMPEQYRCDSCKVVAYHLGEALRKKDLKSRRLKEWEVQEVFDDTCKTGFAGYGISHVNGESVLSGPALKRDNLEAGMGAIQMGGETWEKRLGEICRKFVYDKVGEDEFYDHFRKRGEVSVDLCFRETRDCKRVQLGPQLPPIDTIMEKPVTEKKDQKQKKTKKGVNNIDLSSFMVKLAVEHGVSKMDYTKKRTFQEWEQLLLEAAGRISKKTQKPTDESVEV
jgi:hypothetical protein